MFIVPSPFVITPRLKFAERVLSTVVPISTIPPTPLTDSDIAFGVDIDASMVGNSIVSSA